MSGLPAVSLADLPEAVLCRVMEIAGKESGPSLTLVCKIWRELVFTLPSFWHELRLDWSAAQQRRQTSAWLAAQRALLRRVDGLLHTAVLVFDELYKDSYWRRAVKTLHWLPPSLSSLDLTLCGEEPPAGISLAALSRLTQLTRLRIDAEDLQHQAAGCLAHLPQLEELSIGTGSAHLSPQLTAALGQCSAAALMALTALVIDVRESAEPPPASTLQPLAGLTRLLSLRLLAWPLPPAAVELAAQLTQLTALSLGYQDGQQALDLGRLTVLQRLERLGLGAMRDGQPAPLPPLADMPALRTFTFSGSLAVGNTQLAHGQLLVGANHSALVLQGMAGLGSLPELLAALCPPGRATPLACLTFRDCQLQEEAMLGCGQLLASLTTLRLDSCGWYRAPVPLPALQALLCAAPHLSSLSCQRCFGWPDPASSPVPLPSDSEEPSLLPNGAEAALDGLPGCVASLAHLHHLDWSHNGLRCLPPGPYLEGLQTLILVCNELSAIPPDLCRATALHRLELEGNKGMVVDAVGLSVLMVLSQLQELSLPAGALSDGARAQLVRAVPTLQRGIQLY